MANTVSYLQIVKSKVQKIVVKRVMTSQIPFFQKFILHGSLSYPTFSLRCLSVAKVDMVFISNSENGSLLGRH